MRPVRFKLSFTIYEKRGFYFLAVLGVLLLVGIIELIRAF